MLSSLLVLEWRPGLGGRPAAERRGHVVMLLLLLMLQRGGAVGRGGGGRQAHRHARRGGPVGLIAALDGDEAGGVGEEPLGAVSHPLRLLLVDLKRLMYCFIRS